jgi:hypothetical protein
MSDKLLVLGAAAAVAAALAWGGPAAATEEPVNTRVIQDGCDVGGNGNDIRSIQSHYEPKRDRILVTLRLCDAAKPRATYRLHVDHAAPFVGRTRAQGGCATLADTVVAQTPRGHRGIGSSRIVGNEVRFVVPLDKLGVGAPKQQPLIGLWATSTLGTVEDRAPNREAGDDCAEPQVATETLVQSRVAIAGGIAFVSGHQVRGEISYSNSAFQAITVANALCAAEAANAGYTSNNIHAWISNISGQPATNANLNFGPIHLADGSVVAGNIGQLGNCAQGGPCLTAPFNKDINGNAVPRGTLYWTATSPQGTDPGDDDNCTEWTSSSGSGILGDAYAIDVNFTEGASDDCTATHSLLCIQVDN